MTTEQTLVLKSPSAGRGRSLLAARTARRRQRWPALPLALDLSLVWLFVILAGSFALNFTSLNSYFHGDDFVALTDITSRPTLQHLREVFLFQDSDFYWRPLGHVYYELLYSIDGLNPLVFHLGNLTVFLLTTVLLYQLALRLTLSRAAAVIACLLFSFLPNHVVSVAWITNGPRLLSLFFVMASLLLVERGVRGGRWRWEVVGFLVFAIGCLADETALGLAPVPILLGLALNSDRRKWLMTSARLLAYGGLAAALIPLQFIFTPDDEPRLARYSFGGHIIDQVWALTSQLVLPLNGGGPMVKGFSSFDTVEWAAGAVAIICGLTLVLLGSGRLRFLALWIALSLAPFSLWGLAATSPRYVYLAAAPFAILVAWLIVAGCQAVETRLPKAGRLGLLSLGAVAVAGFIFMGSQATIARNQQWSNATEPYRILAEGLKSAHPQLQPGSRVVIYYGIWSGFSRWPDAAIQTIYGDQSLEVVNVSRQFSDLDSRGRGKTDVVLYFADGKFIQVPPLASASPGR